ncbi:signal peptidase II [Candidatus Collierbacteria bacterium]|nr:signal peptidase II [Candidatus Collierbacteria bacterium]
MRLVVIEVLLQLLFRRLGFGISNRGISFGLASEIPMVFLILGLILFLLVGWERRSELWWKMMFSGAFANLVTRAIFDGQVWDYLRLYPLSLWFNGADLMIFAGTIVVVWQWRLKYFGRTRTF